MNNDATVTVPNPYKFANGGSPNIAPPRSYGNYSGPPSGPRLAAPLVSEGTAAPAYHPPDLNQIPSYQPKQHQMQAPGPSNYHARPSRGAGGAGAGEGAAAAAGAAVLGAGEAAGGLEAAGLVAGLL